MSSKRTPEQQRIHSELQAARLLVKRETMAGRERPRHCEACGGIRRLVWDHNHTTDEFRGWICLGCNTILGFAHDDPDYLRRLADYIEDPPGAW